MRLEQETQARVLEDIGLSLNSENSQQTLNRGLRQVLEKQPEVLPMVQRTQVFKKQLP